MYGALVEKIFGIRHTRPMPGVTRADGVDYMILPTWKVYFIHFLNIAGLGPIFGAIMGVMFGPAAFLWIVFGTIFGGAVHDYLAAMVSLRAGGASLPDITGHELTNGIKQMSRAWTIGLLVLVGAVFVVSPAGLISVMTGIDRMVWVVVIFIYYMLATVLPVDKIIGNLYPVFGFALLFMAAGMLVVLLFEGWPGGMFPINDGMWEGLHSRHPDSSLPVFPMMCVSIACGALSGYHASQSPMMVRCLKNERMARPIFYGAMVSEGLVALIWAAAAIAYTGGYEQLTEYITTHKQAGNVPELMLVTEISYSWLGTIGGVIALFGVLAAPVTSGDTAFRSARLIVAEVFHIDQKSFAKRMLITVPLFLAAILIMNIDFSILWRYFAWCNQTLSVFTLWALTVYLARHGKAYIITMLPGMFMTGVSVTYICCAPVPEGFGLSWSTSIALGSAMAVALCLIFMYYEQTRFKPMLRQKALAKAALIK